MTQHGSPSIVADEQKPSLDYLSPGHVSQWLMPALHMVVTVVRVVSPKALQTTKMTYQSYHNYSFYLSYRCYCCGC